MTSRAQGQGDSSSMRPSLFSPIFFLPLAKTGDPNRDGGPSAFLFSVRMSSGKQSFALLFSPLQTSRFVCHSPSDVPLYGGGSFLVMFPLLQKPPFFCLAQSFFSANPSATGSLFPFARNNSYRPGCLTRRAGLLSAIPASFFAHLVSGLWRGHRCGVGFFSRHFFFLLVFHPQRRESRSLLAPLLSACLRFQFACFINMLTSCFASSGFCAGRKQIFPSVRSKSFLLSPTTVCKRVSFRSIPQIAHSSKRPFP